MNAAPPALNTVVEIVDHFEGEELEAYPDAGSELGKACEREHLQLRDYRQVPDWEKLSGHPWTIGRGHTGKDVYPGLRITKEHSDELFKHDLVGFYAQVDHCQLNLNANQREAVTDFVYNLGIGTFLRSGVCEALRAGDTDTALRRLMRYTHSGGVELKGLVERRVVERELFLRDDNPLACDEE